MLNSWSFSRNSLGQKGMARYIQSTEREKYATKITVPSKDLIQNWWRNKKLFRQAKVKRIQYDQTSFTTNVQFSSVAQSCPTLCDPMNHSTPGVPVHHQLLEFTQTLVHQVVDAIQPSHHLSSPSPPAPNPSQHQGLFQWVKSSHEVAKVLEFQLRHQSFQWTPRTDLL